MCSSCAAIRRGLLDVDLHALFADPILEQTLLDPGYSGHTNDVWLVRTAREEVVVRVVRLRGELEDPFWWGCRRLFGVDPRRLHDLRPLNALLCRLSPVPAPQVLRHGWIAGRQYAVVERLPGSRLATFAAQPAALLEHLGQTPARIHRQRFAWCGHPSGRWRLPLAAFHQEAVATLQEMVPRFYPAVPGFTAALPALCRDLLALPPPEAGALVMPDLDPTQFLAEGDRLTALVDTEAYGVRPRELDFVALEYLLDAAGVAACSRGYARVMPLPALAAVRQPYRYLYRVLDVPEEVALETWLAHPARFCNEDPYPWQRRVFDHLALPAKCQVLEVGCGPGKLWLENAERLPPGWSVTLTDLSPSILQEERPGWP